LLREEIYVSDDTGYIGVDKRPEHQDHKMIWSIAARPSTYKKYGKQSLIAQVRRKIEYAKTHIRAKIEHLFQVIEHQFGCALSRNDKYTAQ
jgi:IS5 family transposase